jgi:hypothetical protein
MLLVAQFVLISTEWLENTKGKIYETGMDAAQNRLFAIF